MCFFIDRSLNILKWPTAVALLLCSPELMTVFVAAFNQVLGPGWILFWMGAVVYLLIWKLVFSARLWGSWLPTFIHELNHAVVAILTLHRISDFHASYRRGGHVRYVGGEGNWLITIAPYVVPTLSLSCGCTRVFFEDQSLFWFAFGAALGFDAICVWRECHREQTDLKELGLLFSLLVVPLLNIVVLSCIFLWMDGGLSDVMVFLHELLNASLSRAAEAAYVLYSSLSNSSL